VETSHLTYYKVCQKRRFKKRWKAAF